jgi:hypothetical protein
VCLVYSQCEYIDEFGQREHADSDGVALDDPRSYRRLAHFLGRVHMYNITFALMRAAALRKTRLHGLYPMADHVLFAELAMLGVFVEIPEPLLRIRRHPGRTFTANKSAQALRELFLPGSGRGLSLLGVKVRRELEVIRSAMLVPPRFGDKVMCTAVAAIRPQWRSFTAFGGRQRRKLFGKMEHEVQ